MLLKLIQLKFGVVAPALANAIISGTADEHERWTERVLSATSADDVIA